MVEKAHDAASENEAGAGASHSSPALSSKPSKLSWNIRSPFKGTKATAPPPPADLIQKITGPFGKYQLLLCILVFLSKIPIAFHQFAIVFVAPPVQYTCDGKPKVCPCANPVYDKTLFSNTIIMQWNLICGDHWYSSLHQTMFQLGTLIGSLLFGAAADRYGRKIPMLVAVIIQIISGIGAAFCGGYWCYTIIRMITGFSVGGTMVVGFVIVMEFMGPQYRATVSALYQVPFNIGHILLPLISYSFRDYTDFQLVISVPIALLLSYICLLPETPRWLIAVNRTDEAVKILERVAKINKLPTANIKSEVETYQAALHANATKKGTVLDLLRTPNLRKNIIAMSINWLACSYFFYGVGQYTGQLAGSIFLNVAAGACFALVGSFVSIPMFKAIGRKPMLIIFNFISAASLFLLIVVPEGIGKVFCACIGSIASFIVFVLVYLYCSEMFPTVLRNAAIGVSSMMARVGSMVAPKVLDLKFKAEWLPPFVFAMVPLIAGFVAFLLPETKGCPLMTTIEEGEEFGKKSKA